MEDPYVDHCCGHDHSKPAKESSVLNADAAGHLQTTLRVAGMDCADEVEAIERVLRPLKGIREVRVNLMGGKVTLLHDESVNADDLIKAIGGAGLQAVRDGDETADLEGAKRMRQISVAVSGFFTGLGLLLQWLKLAPLPVVDAAFGVAIVAGGWFILPKAWRAIARFALDMNVLMTVAVIGALAIHEWSEGAAVTFLFALSELLEAFSLTRARKAVRSLLQLTPETALLKNGDTFSEVPVGEVVIGSIIAIKSGARIPLDGEVTNGASSINQAPITGESMPVEKKSGTRFSLERSMVPVRWRCGQRNFPPIARWRRSFIW